MYSPVIRLALIGASLVLGALALYEGESIGWLLFGSAALLAVGYWRSASIRLGWRAFMHGDYARLERYLAQTRRPEWLAPQQRAYYAWLQGEAARHRGELDAAQRYFRVAVAGRLRSRTDRSFAYSRLAEAALTAGDVSAARDAIAHARALQPPPFVQALLSDLEYSIPAG